MNVSQHWENASPTMKRVVMAAAAVSVFVVFGTFVAIMDRSKTRPKPTKTESDATVMMPARKNTDMESLASTSTALQRRVQQVEIDRKTDMAGLHEQLKQIRELVHGNDGTTRDMADLKARLESVTKRLEELQSREPPKHLSSPAPVAKLPPLSSVIPRNTGSPELVNTALPDIVQPSTTSVKPAASEYRLRVIGASDAKQSDARSANATTLPQSVMPSVDASRAGGESARDAAENAKGVADSMYLPMGSMIQGVLLNGLDAPTSGAAQRNPTPVLIRIKHDAIGPNYARMGIRECFVIASGYGVMSTERANLRTEGISCVREDGGVIETNLNGYVIGEDGKVGMRGRLVTKQGAVIAQSLGAGILSGLGKSLTPTGVTGINLNPTGTIQTQSPDFNTAMEAGLLGGASSTLNQISKHYLDIAKEMVPVVEIDAMRPATIVLTRGGSLRLNSK